LQSRKKIFEKLILKDKNLIHILDLSIECPFIKKPIIKEDILFFELAQSIAGQQISAKAADTIWKRVISVAKTKKLFLIYISKSSLKWAREQGLSGRKHQYIKSIAKDIVSGKLSLKNINSLSDKNAINYLISLKGVGPWTAEMFLMFAYKRLDIFSVGDVALRRAVSELYKVDREDLGKINSIAERWKPYRSVVCWYLWEYLAV
jgi:DNA-3-methyladenine glycosylase II